MHEELEDEDPEKVLAPQEKIRVRSIDDDEIVQHTLHIKEKQRDISTTDSDSDPDIEQEDNSGTMDWSELPDHIVIQIFSHLPLSDRLNCCLVCKAWNLCFGASCLWQASHFQFFSECNSRSLQCLEKYGRFLKKVCISVDQRMDYNRANALQVMDFFSKTPDRRLTSLTIVFRSENPLFYSGKEFVEALKRLFALPPVTADCEHQDEDEEGDKRFTMSRLTEVNLSQLDVPYDNTVFDILGDNHPSLEVLDIQNIRNRCNRVCKVTWDCMYRLVKQCLYLRELHLFHSNLSDEVLFLLAQKGRPQMLEYLSIKCCIEEKYHPYLSVKAWSAVTTALPRLRVQLLFDHTCPQDRVLEIMQPVIPVVHLQLDSYTMLHEEVERAGNYYSATLEKLTLRTMGSVPFYDALLGLAAKCKEIKQLYVYCVIPEDVKQKLLELCPKVQKSGKYYLKDIQEPAIQFIY